MVAVKALGGAKWECGWFEHREQVEVLALVDKKGSNHLSNCINKVKSTRQRVGPENHSKTSILQDYLGCITKGECRIRNCVFLELMNVEIE